MTNPRRMVRRSLASRVSAEVESKRYRELRDRPQSLRRTSMLALHACALRAPQTMARLFGMRYIDWEAEHIGSGFEFTVFRVSKDEVLKIAHNTIGMQWQEQQEYARRRQTEYRYMASWLGEFTLPQSISVEPLPFLPSQNAVQVRQPYRHITDPELFALDAPHINISNVVHIQTQHPGSGDQLLEFVERSRSLHRAQTLLPDTNGRANLVMASSDLRMVDGQPISHDHEPVQQVILGQLTSLKQAIA